MFTIRGKLTIYALEIIAAVTLLLAVPPWESSLRLTLFAVAVVAIVLAILTGRSIAVAVEELARATRRIGEGDYETAVPVRTTDEIGQLAGEIERMRVLLGERVRLLESFGRQLEQKVDERTRQLQEANDRLELIHAITNAVNSSLDFQGIFDAVVAGTRGVVEFEQASVARITDDRSEAIVFAISEGHSELTQNRRMPLAGSRIEAVLRSRRPAVFDRRRSDPSQDTLLFSSIAREVVLPLTLGEEVIGTFNLGSHRADAFSPSECVVLEQIAAELAVALQRAAAWERERAAVRQLQELSDLKSEFVSKVSHELRTPLTSILGYVDNILDGIAGPVDGKPRTYLVRIRDNGQRLLQMINDLLDLSRIEAGEEEIFPVRVELGPLLQETVDTVRPIAESRRVELRVGDASTLAIVADRDKVARILLNLLQNAIKFTPAGGDVEVAAMQGKDGFVHIEVRDDGAGIEARELERIFDRFHQVRRPGDRRTRGTGLGLPISRELARMHGGDLLAESTPGVGSTFRLLMPVEATHPELLRDAANSHR